MKKLLIIAALALCLTALVGTAAMGGGANSAAADAKATFPYPMVPGDWISSSSNLDGLMQDGYTDVFFMINVGSSTGTWSMDIEDCCIMGDTMLALKVGTGGLDYDYCTSPCVVSVGPVSLARYQWVLVITGYLDCPGLFPAGYYFDIHL